MMKINMSLTHFLCDTEEDGLHKSYSQYARHESTNAKKRETLQKSRGDCGGCRTKQRD